MKTTKLEKPEARLKRIEKRLTKIEKWMRETDKWGNTVNGIIADKIKGESAIGFYHEDDGDEINTIGGINGIMA